MVRLVSGVMLQAGTGFPSPSLSPQGPWMCWHSCSGVGASINACGARSSCMVPGWSGYLLHTRMQRSTTNDPRVSLSQNHRIPSCALSASTNRPAKIQLQCLHQGHEILQLIKGQAVESLERFPLQCHCQCTAIFSLPQPSCWAARHTWIRYVSRVSFPS